MRKVTPLLTAVLVGSLATAAFAQGVRTHAPRVDRAETGLTTPSDAAPADVVRGYLRHSDRALSVARENKAKEVTHVQLTQTFEGRTVYGAYVKATVDGQGRLRSVIDDTVDLSSGVGRTALSESDALNVAIAHRFRSLEMPALHRAPRVAPVIVPLANGRAEEGFLVETWEEKSNLLWHTVVGADGTIRHQELRTNTDSYFIFPIQPGLTAQTVVNGPGTGNTESPSGWVTNNTTIGNNVDAYLDRDNNNAADTNGRPTSSTKDFIFAHDPLSAPTTLTNQMLAVSNLFYLNNVIHDKLYRHGFNEAGGNFQTNNFGKGGAGNDPVNAEAQDGGGTNNANFSTPTDGSRPRMQMYLWNTLTPNLDGDLDSDIVYHEYGHGLTWRMIGSMGGGLAGSIGEGMSDVVAIFMNGDDKVGEYSTNNYTRGIRRYPYTNYPLTYASANTTSVHGNGEIYAATLWKLRGLWLGAGYSMDSLWDAVIDGMNYTPANPEFEEMRDGILASSPTQAQDCLIWDAFASMGIGLNAVGTDSCVVNCTISITQDFNKPVVCGGTAPAITLTVSGAVQGRTPKATLSWSGITGTNVDVFRNNVKIVTTANDGNHVDSLAKGTTGTFTYKVCNVGTTTCSANASVTF
ncbi:MAG TPA: M36 family metallopeptidase [Thermoanaerobaculia bacterium]|nr:M36 family metallopeptidase [Thermoanaerobaculia bacterium]